MADARPSRTARATRRRGRRPPSRPRSRSPAAGRATTSASRRRSSARSRSRCPAAGAVRATPCRPPAVRELAMRCARRRSRSHAPVPRPPGRCGAVRRTSTDRIATSTTPPTHSPSVNCQPISKQQGRAELHHEIGRGEQEGQRRPQCGALAEQRARHRGRRVGAARTRRARDRGERDLAHAVAPEGRHDPVARDQRLQHRRDREAEHQRSNPPARTCPPPSAARATQVVTRAQLIVSGPVRRIVMSRGACPPVHMASR